MRCAQPIFAWSLLVILPVVIGLFVWSWRVKQKLTRQFIHSRLLSSLTIGVSVARQKFRLVLLTLAVAGVFLAAARPQWGFAWEEAKQQGLDIIVAIDTSRSMLATDVLPNRLQKAKLAAFDLMQQAKSDRLGIVAFAGAAFLQSPLTLDDQAFRQGIDALQVGIIPQGGTSLSSAIRTALDSFEKGNDNHKVLILFTDGEDHDADTETMDAAKEAAKAGMKIFTVGVGTPEGELLRVTDDQGSSSFVKDDDGNVVKSRLNKTLLEQIATETGGFYLPLQGANPMETLYARGLEPLPKSEETTRLAKVYRERYHWPLGFAILCLIVEFLLPESTRARRKESNAPVLQKLAALICLILLPLGLRASPSSAFHDYQSGDYKSSFEEYNRLANEKTNDYRLHYDAGTAAYKAKQLETAEKQFNATLAAPEVAPDLQTQERTYYNLGNTLYHMGEPQQEPDKKEDMWKQAIDSYTHALTLNTNDFDAKNNLAYVQRKLEQLKQQQQQQQKQDKNKDNKDQKDQKDQQQQNQQKQNQKDQKDQKDQKSQQSKDGQKSDEQKQKEAEEKKKQEQAQKDKEKKEQEAKANPTDKRDKEQQEAEQAAAAGKMTKQEARQILEAQKDDEKSLIFAPENQQVKTQPGKFKDW